MTRHSIDLVLGLILISACAAAMAQDTRRIPRPDGVTTAKVYEPDGACRGIAVLSHGAGGSENGLAYLASYLRDGGYLAIVPGHALSGRTALRAHMPQGRLKGAVKEGLGGLVTDADAYRDRFADIQAARDWGKTRCRSDFNVLIGHSMGAATTMLLAGADNRLGLDTHIAFNAYVAMSPQGVGRIFPPGAWRGIRAPVYSLTGTEDAEIDADWTSRLQPYRDMAPGCKWQGVVEGGSHRDFGGGGTPAETALITGSIDAFLAAVRSGKCNDGYRGAGIRIEVK